MLKTDAVVKYLAFDIESVADGRLVAEIQYPGEKLTPIEAITKFREQRLASHGSDFIPYTFQLPVSIAVAKIRGDFRLDNLVTLDEPDYRPHIMTDQFWRGWEYYGQPALVTFNGRGFDVPLLELAAFRYGISVPQWFADGAKSFDQPRYRYNTRRHIDLCELMTNFGSTRFNGGLNLAANLLGKPGKMEVKGCMVQDMYDEGRLAEINAYCRCDVLDTYFVFLRSRVMIGQLTLDQEQRLVRETRQWLEARADDQSAYRDYLENWGEWHNPWVVPEPEPIAEAEPEAEVEVVTETATEAVAETAAAESEATASEAGQESEPEAVSEPPESEAEPES